MVAAILMGLFVPGEESFIDLLRDPNHLAFEFITGVAQTLVIDLFVLAFAWPIIRRHIHRDVEEGIEETVEELVIEHG